MISEARRTYQKAWRVANRDKFRAYNLKYRTTNPTKYAYSCHKRDARARGIGFLLTFEEWLSIWGANLPMRGSTKGKLCMARHGDAGAYAVGNVSIILHSQNVSDARTRVTPL